MTRRVWLAAAWTLGGAAYGAVWWSLTWCGLLAAAAGLCVVVAGAIDAAAVIDDCGYSDTPQGQEAIEDAPHFRAWERQLAGTWPPEAGAVE